MSIKLDGIHAGYSGTDVLRDVSLEVRSAECVGVLGPNGAGKSTLLKVVSGQLGIRYGTRVVDGADTGGWRPNRLARAGVRWVGEPRPIFPTLTVEENLEIGGITHRSKLANSADRVYELLPALATKRAARAASLSGGQQQMLAIGQALMTSPRYLCLDEPSLGLAPSIVELVANLISDLAEQGVGILWAEQFPDIAIKRCSAVVVLSAGRIVASGAPETVSSEDIHAAYLGRRVSEDTGTDR